MTDSQNTSLSGGKFTTVGSHNAVDDVKHVPLDGFSTANRPVNVKPYTMIYDTTLNKPIWAKTGGATPVWIDATGATV